MRVLQPVLWSKGTFLTPQHLQAQDRFIESVVQFRSEALHYQPWGLRKLVLDQEALGGGAAAVLEASGILPDGTPFEVPGSDPAPPARALGEFFGPGKDALDLWLALPEFRPNAPNVSPANQELSTRFVAEVESIRDENDGLTERPVQVARRNLRLLVEGENLHGNTLIRIARVSRSEGGLYRYDAAFVPPLLDMRASPAAMGTALRLLEVLSAKSSQLAGTRRQKNLSLAEFTVSDIANFWLLYAVNSHLPELRHFYETRGGHPERLFALMLSLASVLTTFSSDLQPRDLPTYVHDGLGPPLAELEEKLHYLLETVVPSQFLSLPLRLVAPSIYAATLAEEKYFRGTKMLLAVRAKTGQAELISKGPKLIKVCSATHIEHLVRQALPGLVMLHKPQPPSAIAVKLDYQYFSLSQSGLAWEAVERSRNIAAYIPADFPEPQVELVILLPTS
jgi:type VI secretion system protein ImpJ